MTELPDRLRAIGEAFRAAEQHQHADAIAEAVAHLERQAIADNLAVHDPDHECGLITWPYTSEERASV